MESQIEKKRYAVCIHNELRAVKTTRDKFYENVVERLNADVFVITRDSYKPESIHLYDKNLVKSFFYNEIREEELYFNLPRLINSDNYLNTAHLQWYYNYYKICEIIGDVLEKNYEYIILTRSDYLHLFEFPDILGLIQSKSSDTDVDDAAAVAAPNDVFWCYEGYDWGGINMSLICVPSVHIKEYLKCFYEFLQDEKNIDELNNLHLNAERFMALIFAKKKWEVGRFLFNAFITCDSYEEKTTWASIKYDDATNTFFKHEFPFETSRIHLSQYNEGKRWKYQKTVGFPNISL